MGVVWDATFYDIGNTSKYHGMVCNKVSALRSAKSAAEVSLASSFNMLERSVLATK